MFFIHFLEHVLTLHPSFFGSHVKEYLSQKLLDDVEGICTGDYYIVCVMDMYDISEGKIIPGSGLAEYTIVYRAIVWKPFKGETVRDRDKSALYYLEISFPCQANCRWRLMLSSPLSRTRASSPRSGR